MQPLLRHQIWIAALAALVFFFNLGATGLWDEDEPWYATCAREMAERGDWVVPTFNGALFPEKPPLMFWLMIIGYKLFGMTEFAARFWSAVFGVGTALTTYHLGRRLFSAEVGFWAGLIMSSTVMFTVSARAATVDSALTFITTVALAVFATSGSYTASNSHTTRPPQQTFVPGPWLSFAAIYAAIGLAVLAKGPVGLLLPVATMGLFLMIMNRPGTASPAVAEKTPLPPSDGRQGAETNATSARFIAKLGAALRLFAPSNVFRAAWQLRPLTATALVAAVALPWYVLVEYRTNGQFLSQFLGEQNFQRVFRPMQSHRGPIVYYVPAILVGFFPWSVFLGPALVDLVRRMREKGAWHAGLVFLACWAGLWVAFFSLVSTKLPHYVLPAYPALALMTGVFLDGWLRDPGRVGRAWILSAAISVIAVGIGILVVVPVVASIFLPGEEILGLLGLILVFGGALCMYLARRAEYFAMLKVFAAMSVLFVTAIFGVAALRVDRHQNAHLLLTQLRQRHVGQTELVAYRYLKQSFVWYAGHPVPRYTTPEQLRSFLQTAECPCVITNSDHEAEIEREFPGVFCSLARQKRFLRRGDVVMLARRADSPTLRLADKGGCPGK